MINKKPKNLLTIKELELELCDLVSKMAKTSFCTRENILNQWDLVGVYYKGDDYRCRCRGGCNARAILHNAKGDLYYDFPACLLIDIPHLNPIPIEESYKHLTTDPMGCMQYEALRMILNTKVVSMEDYVHYTLIPFSDQYELNERETAIVQTVNTAFTTHIEECDSKYQQQRHSR